MSAQSVAPRSRPSPRPSADDAVLQRAIEFSTWARANIRVIVIAAVVVAVAGGSLLVYRTQQAEREQRAASEFMQLEATVSSGNAALAARDLESYVQRFAGTDYATEARMLLARLRIQEGNGAAAIELLEPVAEPGSQLGTQATLLQAAAQQSAGQTEQAIQTYLTLGERAELDYVRQDALASAAALRAQGGDVAGAAELYRRLVDVTEEGSQQRALYQMRLAEMEAQAQAGGR